VTPGFLLLSKISHACCRRAQLLAFFALSTGIGAFGWAVVYCLKRDGWHRLEWVAFLPLNYGGRSLFDTSSWARPR
jgi:hypothetical protein